MITHSEPKPVFFVGGEPIDIPNTDCQQKVAQALAKHAPVSVSDPRCEAAMNRALELQRTHPEPGEEGSPN